MKRIGILTYHCIPNFGAQLQTLSTIGYLRNNGYEPIVLNWYPADLEDFYLRRAPLEQNQMQFDFSQGEMPVSSLCRTLPDLCSEIKRLQLDFIFLGSDALFDYVPQNTLYNYSIRKLKKVPITTTSNHKLPNPFWGSFNDMLDTPVPLVGYAISSQNMPYSKVTKEEKKELGRLLQGFSFLSVRDEWTKKMVESIGGLKNISLAPDPVFAFNQNYPNIPTRAEILKKYSLPDKYILISFVYNVLGDEYINTIIDQLEKLIGYKCVSFPMPDELRTFNTKHIIELPLNPIDWYSIIKYSNGYIGERMHPIIVSLHNNIPFFCFDQYGATQQIIPRLWSRFIPESSKIYDILCKCGLQDNSCFYSQVNKLRPKDVVNRFLSFDSNKCNKFSQDKLTDYNNCMQQLLSAVI